MKVRFADQAIRCRVTPAELERLLTGRNVALEVALPRDHRFRLSIRPSALDTWQLDHDPTGLWLTIPRAQLEYLSQTVPSTEGIEQRFPASDGGSVHVSFEVDLQG
jgi:hypothetical protein